MKNDIITRNLIYNENFTNKFTSYNYVIKRQLFFAQELHFKIICDN